MLTSHNAKSTAVKEWETIRRSKFLLVPASFLIDIIATSHLLGSQQQLVHVEMVRLHAAQYFILSAYCKTD